MNKRQMDHVMQIARRYCLVKTVTRHIENNPGFCEQMKMKLHDWEFKKTTNGKGKRYLKPLKKGDGNEENKSSLEDLVKELEYLSRKILRRVATIKKSYPEAFEVSKKSEETNKKAPKKQAKTKKVAKRKLSPRKNLLNWRGRLIRPKVRSSAIIVSSSKTDMGAAQQSVAKSPDS